MHIKYTLKAIVFYTPAVRMHGVMARLHLWHNIIKTYSLVNIIFMRTTPITLENMVYAKSVNI